MPDRRQLILTGAASLGASLAAGLRPAFAQVAAEPAPGPDPRAQAAVREAGTRLPAVGQTLRLPDVQLLDGRTWGERQAAGRVVVLYWWASWCPFCAATSPHVEALWRAQRSRGLDVLGLSIDRREADARAYMERRGYTFAVAMLTPEVARALPKPRGLPVTVLRARDGKVAFAESGEMFPETIEGLKQYL